MCRFSDAGDSILVTSEKDKLAGMVLGEGRLCSTLVADSTQLDDVNKQLDTACEAATKRGWFSALANLPIMVGPGALPSSPPASNLSADVRQRLAQEEQQTDDEADE